MSDSEERAQLADLIDQLENEGMALDGGGDASGVHLLFRTVHNLKSLSAYMGFKELAASFHQLEDGLDAIRRGREPWTAEWSDRTFQSIDLARALLGGEAGPAPRAPVLAPAAPKNPWGLPLTEAQASLMAEALLEGLGVYRIEKLFKAGLDEATFATLPVMEDVAEVGRPIALHPSWAAYAQGPEEQVVKILFASPRTHEELGRILFDPLIELQAPEPMPEPGQDRDLRFLVIEDDAATGALLGHLVGRHGTCLVAGNARRGFAEFIKAWERSEPFHILFLDLGLPDLSGHAILSAVRKFESEHQVGRKGRCRVLICTASDSHADILASLARDADGYFTKPFSPAAIEEKITLLKELRLAEG